ncbi:MAG TPA: CDP-alcohol phosphatidyltransferase family protein [Chthoniobacterales bacterium]|nr:CDP-alcohol phosphatidyltransferase family protein [Chthoniobacterales bacterium]
MSFRDGQSAFARRLAFKAIEIEERTDIFFFRPCGWVIARGARVLGLTPTHLSILRAITGIAGGALLYYDSPGLLAFALLILSEAIDSSDGQLARMTGQITELGRVFDGLGDYVAHGAIYIAIAAGVIHRGGSRSVLVWMLLAGLSNAIQSQMYDYHRTAYVTVVSEGRAPGDEAARVPSWIRWLYSGYTTMQRWLIGPHERVESALAERSDAGRVREEDRARYRECFYRLVHGWNILGSNTGLYALGILIWLHRVDLFLIFMLVPMNLALIALRFWQRSADRKFLAGL